MGETSAALPRDDRGRRPTGAHRAVLSTAIAVMALLVTLMPAAGSRASALLPAADEPKIAGESPKVRIVVKAPKAVAATVTVSGSPRRVVAKPPGTRSVTRTFKVEKGRHKVLAEDVTFNGRVFVPAVSTKSFVAEPGDLDKVVVRYAAVDGVPSHLEVTDLQADSVALAWDGGGQARLALRRTAGTIPPASPTAGTEVAISGTTASDTGLASGHSYTYALFARAAGRWVGPLTVTVGTPEQMSTDSVTASYLAGEATELLPGRKFTVVATGRGQVKVTVQGDPVSLGQVLVLPISESLPSGYIGTVTSIAADGTVTLSVSGIGDAFDYFAFDVPEFDTEYVDALMAAPSTRHDAPRTTTARARTASLPSCLSAELSTKVTLDPSMSLSGYSKGRIVMKKIPWLPDVPVGASLEGSLQVNLKMAAGIGTDLSIACGVDIDPIAKTFMAGPVPMALVFDPKAEVAVSGSLSVSNVGVQAEAGLYWDVAFGAGVDDHADGGLIHGASPLTPVATAKGAVGLTLGGSLTFGPGAAEKGAGAVAGVKGNLDILKAEAAVLRTEEAGDPQSDSCVKLSAGGSAGLSMTAKAWAGRWEQDVTLEIPGLVGAWDYGGPWFWPQDCETPGVNNAYVLKVDEEDNSSATVATHLASLGYNVDTGTSMPEFPGDYHQIWVFGVFAGYDAALVAQLEDFIEDGGSVFINGEHSCCDAVNRGLESLMDSVLATDVGVVTSCTSPCVEQPVPLNPDAAGGIANTPNESTTVLTSALGYYTGVPLRNQLVVLSGYVGGTVWEPSDMAEGHGRLVTLSDSNWSNARYFPGNNERFVANVAAFLRK